MAGGGSSTTASTRICIIFQVEAGNLQSLWCGLQDLPVSFTAASSDAVTRLAGRQGKADDEVTGTLEVTFTSGTGNLRRTVPSVPG